MPLYVRMTDTFMSGWGRAASATNVMVVECQTTEQAEQIQRAARRRSEMKRVAICLNKPAPRAGVLYSHKKYEELGGSWLEA